MTQTLDEWLEARARDQKMKDFLGWVQNQTKTVKIVVISTDLVNHAAVRRQGGSLVVDETDEVWRVVPISHNNPEWLAAWNNKIVELLEAIPGRMVQVFRFDSGRPKERYPQLPKELPILGGRTLGLYLESGFQGFPQITVSPTVTKQ